MDKRYQVFVSSTYADLQAERRAVTQAVIEMDCIPAGMELFPAVDEQQLQFIKSVIDDCDYYLLIIGGRYGSTTPEGVSYTEKEYDYAVSRGLKVIALIHSNPDEIPLGKSEKDPLLREKLEQFRKKVSMGRLVKHWKSADELPGLVTTSLAHTIKMFPAVGWIRANKAASEDLLTEINELRKQNAKLQAASGEYRPKIQNLAGLQDEIELFGTCKYIASNHRESKWTTRISWGEIFGLVSPYLVQHPTDKFVKSTLAGDAFAKSSHAENWHYPHLDDQIFRTVAVQLQALGLVTLNYLPTTAGGMALFWSNTPAGERLMMELRTVKSVNASEQNKKDGGGRKAMQVPGPIS
jgi:hypothetical protein